MNITTRLRNISPVASPEGKCEHNLHCKWSVSFIFIQSYQRILEWFGLEDHSLHSTLLWAGTPSTSLCFQLASTSTTLGVLIHTCCLNYAILGRKEKRRLKPWGVVGTKDVSRDLCPGPAAVGSPLGHLWVGTQWSLASPIICPHVPLQNFWGNPSRTKPSWAQSQHCMTSWIHRIIYVGKDLQDHQVQLLIALPSHKASFMKSKHKPGNNTLLNK